MLGSNFFIHILCPYFDFPPVHMRSFYPIRPLTFLVDCCRSVFSYLVRKGRSFLIGVSLSSIEAVYLVLLSSLG